MGPADPSCPWVITVAVLLLLYFSSFFVLGISSDLNHSSPNHKPLLMPFTCKTSAITYLFTGPFISSSRVIGYELTHYPSLRFKTDVQNTIHKEESYIGSFLCARLLEKSPIHYKNGKYPESALEATDGTQLLLEFSEKYTRKNQYGRLIKGLRHNIPFM